MQLLLSLIGLHVSTKEIISVATNMFKDHMLNYSTANAQSWGTEYWSNLPSDTFKTIASIDEHDFLSFGNLTDLVLHRQSIITQDRLTSDRIRSLADPLLRSKTGLHHNLSHVNWSQFETDTNTLISFGTDGVPILTASNFIPSSVPGSFASKYRQAPAAVDAHLHKALKDGIAILLPPHTAALIHGRNEMRSSLAPKKGKASGRLTIDPSTNSSLSGTFLNSDEATELCRQTFGDICDQPTL